MAGRRRQCARSRDREWWAQKRAGPGAGGRERPRPRGARREYTRDLRNLRKGRHMSNKGMDRRAVFRGAAALGGGGGGGGAARRGGGGGGGWGVAPRTGVGEGRGGRTRDSPPGWGPKATSP